MTIKEIEERSGLTRANIRFYESEGLLKPERGENKYRNYSQEDLEVLKRIKLLRSLRMPLSEIVALDKGEEKLIPAMDRQIALLQAEQGEIDRAIGVCREIRKDGGEYRTLNAQRYLDSLAIPSRNTAAVLTADVPPKPHCPWRRYFARSFDWMLYGVLWDLFLLLVCHVNLSGRAAVWSLVDLAMTFVLCFFLEPLMLHFFGTTPGKWILGLSLTDSAGEKLEYGDAQYRTWVVFGRGMGYCLPVYHLIRLWKSYTACGEETLEWEDDTELVCRDRKVWRLVALAAAFLALFGILCLGIGLSARPKHLGDLTTAQFCENYNRLADYYRMDDGAELDAAGKWVFSQEVPLVDIIGANERPVFEITETDGAVSSVRFRYESSDNDWLISSFEEEMFLTSLAFAGARKEFGPFSRAKKDLAAFLGSHPHESFAYTDGGFTLICNVEYAGYGKSGQYLFPTEGTEQHYSMEFTITRTPES